VCTSVNVGKRRLNESIDRGTETNRDKRLNESRREERKGPAVRLFSSRNVAQNFDLQWTRLQRSRPGSPDKTNRRTPLFPTIFRPENPSKCWRSNRRPDQVESSVAD
jgi:hypothetical protein